ncbi:hypothetical protein DUNSADRAFT_4359 [Dunaliella salina]|uniref:Encoded protein n=1 Tax=Dunaliella salina TaxID=3046 RepID=A0ABQ7H7T4_DUNSA|nr:hypothetical protein DUNSADRAFT_4359 [Dunaliella salina]|eukprot:KAF5842900.1 hypothetical protein DUNSADRAFT_4359 [Dunaliella salina]
MLSRNYRWKPTAYFSLNSMFANPEKRLFLRAEDACMFFQCGHTYIHVLYTFHSSPTTMTRIAHLMCIMAPINQLPECASKISI